MRRSRGSFLRHFRCLLCEKHRWNGSRYETSAEAAVKGYTLDFSILCNAINALSLTLDNASHTKPHG